MDDRQDFTEGSIFKKMIHFMFPILGALASGVTILIGRYIGEKNNHKIGPLLGRSIAFFLAFAVLFTVLLVIFAEPAARLMKAPEEAIFPENLCQFRKLRYIRHTLLLTPLACRSRLTKKPATQIISKGTISKRQHLARYCRA